MTRRLLVANGNEPSTLWSTGAARYKEGLETLEGQLVVAVRCRLDGVRNNVEALLDSGAEWSVFGGVLAESLIEHATPLRIFSTMHTRLVPRRRGSDWLRVPRRVERKAPRRSATGRTARSGNAAIGDASATSTGQNLCDEVLGRIQGMFHEVPVTLHADDGRDLRITATALLAPDWSGPPVLGYRGFLERLRFALDPGVSASDQWMYFGATG